jgi:hypothetical protein
MNKPSWAHFMLGWLLAIGVSVSMDMDVGMGWTG